MAEPRARGEPGGAATDIPRRVDAVWKLESSRIVAALTRLVHDVGLAEELAQDALVAALEQWPSTGVPENAGAWLTAIAKRRAIDHPLGPAAHPARLHRDAAGARPRRPYLLQAAIAACHAQARRAEDTDWARIATLYGSLAALLPTPVVTLNRAVAVGMAEGPQAGLDLADTLVDHPRMRENHLLAGVRADLLARLERTAEARREFERAASLTANRSERSHLRNRADALTTTVTDGRSLSDACTAFLARDDLDAATVRSYAQTLRRLVRTLGERTPLATITPDEVTRAVVAAWGTAAPATWNRHCSAARSFAGWADADHLTAALERRPGSPARAASLPPERVDALCDDPARPLRERALWRLLHESGAPVTTVLALDVEHLDLEDRRARAGGRLVGWRSSSARLLPDLVAGRSRGPVFLSDRRPGPARRPAYADLCPETGRRRLSYERAEYLFKQATRGADPAGEGWTLRMLR